MTQIIYLPLFPAVVDQYFSVSYQGKTHELPPWQKLAILVTAVAGVALYGIGVLFAFGLSYYLRNRLVEQLTADSIIPSLPIQPPPQPVADEGLITQRLKDITTKIDALQKVKKSMPASWEAINNQLLLECSLDGRYFINIDSISYGYTIPHFSPLLLPKGIYCVHSSFSDNMEKTSVSNDYNQMMIEEFGEDNINHMVICFQAPSNNVKKVHKHQLELYELLDINDPVNKKNIQIFDASLR